MMITLRNEAGVTKEVKVGVSWTVFMFGFLTPLYRGDWKWAGILVLAHLVTNMILPGIGGIIIILIFMFKYNEWYAEDLKAKGFRVIK